MRCAVVVLLLASAAWAETVEQSIEAYVRLAAWYPSASGDVTAGGGTVRMEDLGVDDNEFTGFPQVVVGFKRWRITFNAIFVKHEANSVAANDFAYGGATYTAGESIFTKLRFDHFDARVTYAVVKDEAWQVFVGGGAGYFNIDVKVLGEDEEGITLPTAVVPFFNVVVRRTWDRLYVEVDLALMPFDSGQLDGGYVEVLALVGYHVTSYLAAEAGYRYVMVDGAANDGADFDQLALGGFFVGVLVSF